MNGAPDLLSVEDVAFDYALPRRDLFGPAPARRALKGVSFRLADGESMGLVGESGCGKTTLARLVMGLARPTQGRILFQGQDLARLGPKALAKIRPGFQMVFQDPYGSLDPRRRVEAIVAEPLVGLGRDPRRTREAKVADALSAVGLKAGDGRKYPHEFSGGQRQRIAIARALVMRPALIVADEPVSALDVSVQAQVLNLLCTLRADHGLAYLFISHDLAVVRYVSDRVAVMFDGSIVETGPTEPLFAAPRHPYSRALVAAVPGGGRRAAQAVAGDASDPRSEPAVPGVGCAYTGVCPHVADLCRRERPRSRALEPGRLVACHRAEEI
jgi:peptide/nickel transport system ATP-binding protein